MNIALIYSPNWANHILVQLYAIFENNYTPVKVYIISDAEGYIDTSHITSHFGEKHTVEFIDASDTYNKRIVNNTNVDSRFTKYTLYRLLLPELIKDDRLLYIDSDTIVCSDLVELWNMELGDNLIAGVSDIHADKYGLRKGIGIKPTDEYINAGIMLMNLDGIRKIGLQTKWVNEANRVYYPAHDQCIINKTAKGKIKVISNMYNCSISTGLDVKKEEIKIMHYAGTLKPWDNGGVPNSRLWFDYVRKYRRTFGASSY